MYLLILIYILINMQKERQNQQFKNIIILQIRYNFNLKDFLKIFQISVKITDYSFDLPVSC